MKRLFKDKGLDQYPLVRETYDKAKELLNQENPDRKELSDLLDVLDKNPEGVEWVKAEEGEQYEETYSRITRVMPSAYLFTEVTLKDNDYFYQAIQSVEKRIVLPNQFYLICKYPYQQEGDVAVLEFKSMERMSFMIGNFKDFSTIKNEGQTWGRMNDSEMTGKYSLSDLKLKQKDLPLIILRYAEHRHGIKNIDAPEVYGQYHKIVQNLLGIKHWSNIIPPEDPFPLPE